MININEKVFEKITISLIENCKTVLESEQKYLLLGIIKSSKLVFIHSGECYFLEDGYDCAATTIRFELSNEIMAYHLMNYINKKLRKTIQDFFIANDYKCRLAFETLGEGIKEKGNILYRTN
tara:strand:+ start:171 stop:536 length:366 start_codon:yes stop_codon:yes gene_type:complete